MGLSGIKSLFTKTKLFIAVGVAFLIYVTFLSDYNYMKIVEYDNEIKSLKMQIAAAQDSALVYQERLRELDSDTETLEKIVREEYYMKREKEDVYIVKEK